MHDFQKSMSSWLTTNTSKLIDISILIMKVSEIPVNKFLCNFAIVLVTAMGLTSDSVCFGGKSFGTEVILEIFHWSGTMPWWSDEIGRAGPSRHDKMVCRVGGQVDDKSCRVAYWKLENDTTRHDTTRPTFSVRRARQPITLDCFHNVISDVASCT